MLGENEGEGEDEGEGTGGGDGGGGGGGGGGDGGRRGALAIETWLEQLPPGLSSQSSVLVGQVAGSPGSVCDVV